ncbi:adenosine deaminase [Thalassotalea atypica]|uniref:adenosine deaminase n=1 Tax=Thalassotalea atypica TaxID=2054316 RepID=UPI0025745E33|nr:adenosine deaminase [Thalassotalea atypica]
MNAIDPTLPLIDLHRHLDGNIRPSTVWELAQENEITLPESSFEQFLPHIQIQRSEPDLMAFLAKLDWGVNVLKSLDNCRRIAYENVEDAHSAGLDYAELRFSPYYMSKAFNLPVADVVEAVIDGINAGQKDFPVKINLIGILSRTFGLAHCTNELNGILAHKQHITALDLAGDEVNFPAELFEDLFTKARHNNFRITVHAGEAAGPESVWKAIKLLGAERIGHGVKSCQDPYLLDHMVSYNIGVESCLTSNYQTGTVTDLSKHPLTTFLEKGVQVCLNTDDPAVSGIELKHEFDVAKHKLNLNEAQFKQLQLNALNMSFLSDSEKKALLDK